MRISPASAVTAAQDLSVTDGHPALSPAATMSSLKLGVSARVMRWEVWQSLQVGALVRPPDMIRPWTLLRKPLHLTELIQSLGQAPAPQPKAEQERETGLPWLPPSPNLPTFASALVYPGQVLLEGTNLSEGRGTTTPFEVVGAPYIDPFELEVRLLEAARETGPPGVRFRGLRFRPTFDKWAGESCGGVFLHVTDPLAFRPYETTLRILATVKALWPEGFAWRPPPYEYESEKAPIDILAGSSRLREWIDGLSSTSTITEIPPELLGSDAHNEWLKQVRLHLLYE